MATKAERFEEQRQKEIHGVTAGRRAAGERDEPRKTSKKAGMSRAREGSGGCTTRSIRAARKAGAVPEDSAARPSRKSSRRSRGKVETTSFNEEGVPSTRKGEGHTKPSAPLQLRAVARVRSPESRAQRKVRGAVKSDPARQQRNDSRPGRKRASKGPGKGGDRSR